MFYNIWKFDPLVDKSCIDQWNRTILIVLKYANKSKFTFSSYLTSWPQMTFDLDLWPLTAWPYESSHIIPINQVWFQSDFNFSNEATFTFSPILQLDRRLLLTLICDLWPHQHMRVPMLHLWPNFGTNPLAYKTSFIELLPPSSKQPVKDDDEAVSD